MGNRPKEKYGKKLVYRFSAPVIFTLFFDLVAIGIFIVTVVYPYLRFDPSEVMGLDFIMLYVNLFTGEANTRLNIFTEHLAINVFPEISFMKTILDVSVYFVSAFLIIYGILTTILAIGTIILMISGHHKHWKFSYSLTKRMFIASFFYYGIICGINVYSGLVLKVGVYDALYTYIEFGGLLLVVIILHIVYRTCFYDHVYVKNLKTLNKYVEEYEKVNMVVDTTKDNDEDVVINQAPKVQVAPIVNPEIKNKSSDNRKYLPKGLKHIGGHAFSQNTALEEAIIPLGIETLGAGAFANCVNLRVVYIPESVKKIEYNCFFNCRRLERINYGGSREMWKRIKFGSNWLTAAGTNFVVCADGALSIAPDK